jgi:hypothetical protein
MNLPTSHTPRIEAWAGRTFTRSRARNDVMVTSPAQLARVLAEVLRNVRSQEPQRWPNPRLQRARSAPMRSPLRLKTFED